MPRQDTQFKPGKSGQGTDSTAIENPGKRNGEQTGVSQQDTCQGKLTVRTFKSIALRHWSETYQRLTKMSQPWGTSLYGGGERKLIQLGHPLISIGEAKFIHRIMDRVFIGKN